MEKLQVFLVILIEAHLLAAGQPTWPQVFAFLNVLNIRIENENSILI